MSYHDKRVCEQTHMEIALSLCGPLNAPIWRETDEGKCVACHSGLLRIWPTVSVAKVGDSITLAIHPSDGDWLVRFFHPLEVTKSIHHAVAEYANDYDWNEFVDGSVIRLSNKNTVLWLHETYEATKRLAQKANHQFVRITKGHTP